MTRAVCLSGLVPLLLAMSASAQQSPGRRQIGDAIHGLAVMAGWSDERAQLGPAVVNAPYQADEITAVPGSPESVVALSRDSAGRVRRETSGQIVIWDPVASALYSLDPQTRTGWKISAVACPLVIADGGATMRLNCPRGFLSGPQAPIRRPDVPIVTETVTVIHDQVANRRKELLGEQTMQGLPVQGTRIISTVRLPAGTAETLLERWYSPDLQREVLTRERDPRTGEKVVRLANIRRGEPPADIFQVPPGYRF